MHNYSLYKRCKIKDKPQFEGACQDFHFWGSNKGGASPQLLFITNKTIFRFCVDQEAEVVLYQFKEPLKSAIKQVVPNKSKNILVFQTYNDVFYIDLKL